MIKSSDFFKARPDLVKCDSRPAISRRESIGGFASKLERDYADHLRFLMLLGDIDCYLYEPITFMLGDHRKYTPDFIVWYKDGRVEAHEVKGYMWGRDAIRIDWFAYQYPSIPLIVVTRGSRREWEYDRR